MRFDGGSYITPKGVNQDVLDEIAAGKEHFLYHFGIGIKIGAPIIRDVRDMIGKVFLIDPSQLRDMLGDLRFVVGCGKPNRVRKFAPQVAEAIGAKPPSGWAFRDMLQSTAFGLMPMIKPDGFVSTGGWRPIGDMGRYTTIKCGPILISSHGMGFGSAEIWIEEMAMLLHIAGVHDQVELIRLGTGGGVDMKKGEIFIAKQAVNQDLMPYHYVNTGEGGVYLYDASASPEITAGLIAAARRVGFIVHSGAVLSVDGFYGPQFRRDGGTASPLVPEEQMRILAKLRDELGIKMMEMEALVILSRAKAAGIAASLCNVAIVTREQGDQIDSKPHELADFDTRPATVIQEYMRGRLAEEGAIPWRRHNPLGRAA